MSFGKVLIGIDRWMAGYLAFRGHEFFRIPAMAQYHETLLISCSYQWVFIPDFIGSQPGEHFVRRDVASVASRRRLTEQHDPGHQP